jgi:hypothetical protein
MWKSKTAKRHLFLVSPFQSFLSSTFFRPSSCLTLLMIVSVKMNERRLLNENIFIVSMNDVMRMCVHEWNRQSVKI